MIFYIWGLRGRPPERWRKFQFFNKNITFYELFNKIINRNGTLMQPHKETRIFHRILRVYFFLYFVVFWWDQRDLKISNRNELTVTYLIQNIFGHSEAIMIEKIF